MYLSPKNEPVSTKKTDSVFFKRHAYFTDKPIKFCQTKSFLRLLTAVLDLLVFVAVGYAALRFTQGSVLFPPVTLLTLFISGTLFSLILLACGAYRFMFCVPPPLFLSKQLGIVCMACAWYFFSTLLLFDISLYTGLFTKTWLYSTVISAFFTLLITRIFSFFYVTNSLRQGHFLDHVVLVGLGDQTLKVFSDLKNEVKSGVRVHGVFEDRFERHPVPDDLPFLGAISDVVPFCRSHLVDRVLVTFPWAQSERVDTLLRRLRTAPVQIDLVPEEIVWRFPENTLPRFGGVPVITIANGKINEQKGVVKRTEDFFLSSVLLLLFSPIMLAAAIAIKMSSSGPVFFLQQRHGFNNKVFFVFKFRTMHVNNSMVNDAVVKQATKNDPRIFSVGRFLRKTSLDELPQLLNVFIGDMSIVGPRPHAVQHNFQFSSVLADFFARHNVKPGITGWAQVNGLRGETDTPEKMRQRVQYDLEYIERWSLLLDFKILVMTAVVVWFQRAAY